MPERDVDKEARTEEPTQRRIEEARERGQVAKSQEIVSVLVTAAGVIFLWIYAPAMYRGFVEITRWAIEGFNRAVPDDAASGALVMTQMGWKVALISLPIAGVALVAAVMANVMQFGFVASSQPLTPDLNRINPFTGFGRLFSVRTAEMLGLAVGKMTLTAVITYIFLYHRGPKLAALIEGTVEGGFVAVLIEALYLMIALLAAFLAIAVLDLVFQRRQYLVDLRMTREELKEEMRRMEGDPAIRARRRAVMRRLLFSRMFSEVPESDVVIVNPTEYAVALKYRDKEDHAPVVVAKGRMRIAQRIRDLATVSGVPIVERPVLARGLYFSVEVGGEIPQEFYQMVAEVLAYVYRTYRDRKVSA